MKANNKKPIKPALKLTYMIVFALMQQLLYVNGALLSVSSSSHQNKLSQLTSNTNIDSERDSMTAHWPAGDREETEKASLDPKKVDQDLQSGLEEPIVL